MFRGTAERACECFAEDPSKKGCLAVKWTHEGVASELDKNGGAQAFDGPCAAVRNLSRCVGGIVLVGTSITANFGLSDWLVVSSSVIRPRGESRN